MKVKSLVMPLEIKEKIESLEQAVERIERKRNELEKAMEELTTFINTMKKRIIKLQDVLQLSKVQCECQKQCQCGAKIHNDRIDQGLKEESNE